MLKVRCTTQIDTASRTVSDGWSYDIRRTHNARKRWLEQAPHGLYQRQALWLFKLSFCCYCELTRTLCSRPELETSVFCTLHHNTGLPSPVLTQNNTRQCAQCVRRRVCI